MTGTRYAAAVLALLAAVFLLVLTVTTALAIVYALTEGGGRGLGTYALLLAGCLVTWAVVAVVARRRWGAPGPDPDAARHD